MTTPPGRLSVGVAASVGVDLALRIAPALEEHGFHALWVNDTPGSDALSVLESAAQVTSRLVLATGVLPVDRRTPDEIFARAKDLPADRLVLGIGSGQGSRGALHRVRDAATALRAGTSARVVVGALGPRMRTLGAEASDGLVLSWLTPDAARAQAAEAHALAPAAHVALYVRTATDAAARGRLDAETARYAGYPSYRANFDRLGIRADSTTIDADDPAARIAAYRSAADEIVLRAITAEESAEDYLRFISSIAKART